MEGAMEEEVFLKVGSVLKGWDAIVTFITDDHYYAMYESLDGQDKQISTTDYIYDAVERGEIEIVNDATHFKKRYSDCALFETIDDTKKSSATDGSQQ